jgi:transposase
VFYGSFNSERFENFVIRLLTKITPFLGPRLVLVIDNVSTHYLLLVKQLYEEVGVRIEYLLPYLPFLNPIEELFSVLKAWIRRHYKITRLLATFYNLFLYIAIS